MKRSIASLLALCFGFALLLPVDSTAQNDDAPAATAPAAKKESRGPLPDFFGKLGVGEKQRKALYAIDNEYEAKIEVLEKQIAKLEAERDAKLEELLTPGQKLRLKELREEAAERDAAQAKKEAQLGAATP